MIFISVNQAHTLVCMQMATVVAAKNATKPVAGGI
jgi:hypothetical protein